jgi:hypothetical protein
MAGPFREQAVRAYIDPDIRGGLLDVTPPLLARLFVILALTFLAGFVASAVTPVRVTARGRGVVRPSAGVVIVRAPAAGVVRVVQAEVGQTVAPGDVLFRTDVPVVAPVGGTLDALPVHVDEHVGADALVAKIIPAGSDLVGFLAVPARYRAHLVPGQPVRLAFEEFPSSEMGFGRGRVARVGNDLLTPELAQPYLGGIELPAGPNFLVEVELLSMPPRVAAAFRNGMPFEGVVAVREQRILTLLFRPLRALLDV